MPWATSQMYDRTSNGLATVAVDQVNRITSFTFDGDGNMTEEIYPDGNNQRFTYNADSQPLTFTDANGGTYIVHLFRWQSDGRQGSAGQLDDDDVYDDGPAEDDDGCQFAYDDLSIR